MPCPLPIFPPRRDRAANSDEATCHTISAARVASRHTSNPVNVPPNVQVVRLHRLDKRRVMSATRPIAGPWHTTCLLWSVQRCGEWRGGCGRASGGSRRRRGKLPRVERVVDHRGLPRCIPSPPARRRGRPSRADRSSPTRSCPTSECPASTGWRFSGVSGPASRIFPWSWCPHSRTTRIWSGGAPTGGGSTSCPNPSAQACSCDCCTMPCEADRMGQRARKPTDPRRAGIHTERSGST